MVFLTPNIEISEEWKDVISSLPKEKTFTVFPLYKYEGFWYRISDHLPRVISCQKHFEAQDSDVFLVSSPKCGTTWLKAIVFAILNRKQFPVEAENHPLLTTGPHDLVPFLEMNIFPGSHQIPDYYMESTPLSPSSRLFATHTPYVSLPESIKKSSSSKIVYIARNPKDTFVSMWHFMIKLGLLDAETSMEEAVDCFCEGLSPFGPFWGHALEYWKQSLENPERVLFLKYEDIKAQPDDVLRRLALFLDCPFSADDDEEVQRTLKLCSFDHLSSLNVNKTGIMNLLPDIANNIFFRRGEVGDWNNHLSAVMAHKIDTTTKLEFSGSALMELYS